MGICEPTPYIRVKDCVNTLIVTHSTVVPQEEARYEKIDEKTYRVIRTGEIREYGAKARTKGDNKKKVLESFNNLKAIINCNYVHPSYCKFLTLTYAENMTDNSRLRKDLENFWMRLRKYYSDFEYVYVKERQERGAWHIHAITFFNEKAPFMPNELVQDCWKKGFVNVQGFRDDINNLGNYLCAYLTDGGKSTKKGARLENYESGIRLFNCSKGIKRPQCYRINYWDYVDLCFDEQTILLSDKEVHIKRDGEKPIYVKREMFGVL